MRLQYLNTDTVIVLPDMEIEAIPLSLVKGELTMDIPFVGFENLMNLTELT